MHFHKSLAAGVSTAILLSGLSLAVVRPAFADETASIGRFGKPCLPGKGVTIMVSLSGDADPNNNKTLVGCAPISSEPDENTVSDRMKAAGIEGSATSFALSMADGKIEVARNDRTMSFWSNTAGGTRDGAIVDEWQPSTVGLGFTGVSEGQVWAISIAPTKDAPLNMPLADLMGLAGVDPTPETDPSSDPQTSPNSADAESYQTVDPTPYGPTKISTAQNAASWVAAQFAGNGKTDAGSASDAIFALASAGVARDTIAALAAQIMASGESYIGTRENPDYARIGKIALALQVAGVDPTEFQASDGSSRNLIAELSQAMSDDGSWPKSSTTFKQPLMIMALARTRGGAPQAAVDFMLDAQCQDQSSPNYGTWGMNSDGDCSSFSADSTGQSISALLASGQSVDDPAIVAAVQGLKANQSPDGSFSTNTNSTGLAVQGLWAAGATDAAAKAADYIATMQVSCGDLASSDVLTTQELGAIAWNSDNRADLLGFGIAEANRVTVVMATTQAILGLSQVGLNQLTAAGAGDDAPAGHCAAATGGAADNPNSTGTPTVDNPAGAFEPVTGQAPAATGLPTTGLFGPGNTIAWVFAVAGLALAGLGTVVVWRRRRVAAAD